MSRVQFFPGLHFWRKGREYVIKQRLIDGDFQICEVITNNVSTLTENALIQLFFQDELEFKETDISQAKSGKKDYRDADFTQLQEELKQEVNRRERYVKAALEKNLTKRNQESLVPIIEQVAQEIEDPKPPSYITLYRWLRSYERSGKDIRSLVPNYRRRGDYRPKIAPEVRQIIDKAITAIYLTPSRASVDAVYDEVIAQISLENNFREETGIEKLKIPHRSTIYRLIVKLEPYEKARARYGKRAAELMYAPVQQGTRAKRPLERVEIDHTKLPFFVVDSSTRLPIGTPALTSAIDKYSGLVVGYYLSFEPFSFLSVMQCLLNAIRPKDYVKSKFPSVQHDWVTYGLMETLVVDNAKEFYSSHFKDACQQLQIHIQYTPPKMPWYKAGVERYFGMLNTKLLAGQPGNLLADFSSQYDYDPKQNAVVSFEALQEMIHLFIIDIHNQDAHPEFKCPRSEVWLKAISLHPPALPPSNKELRVLVGLIEKRVISRRGVEFEGLYYNSPELVRLRSYFEQEDKRRKSGTRNREKATIKIDPNDLSNIYVFDPTFDNFIVVPALSFEYTQGLTLWQHKVIKNLAACEYKKVDLVALALAKKRIQEIVEREWQTTKKGRTRQAMARWKGIGRSGLNTGYQKESLVGKAFSHSSGDTQILDTFSNQPKPLAGLSDLGSAFHLNSASPLEGYYGAIDVEGESLELVELNPSASDLMSETLAATQKPQKRSRGKKSMPQQVPPSCTQENSKINSSAAWEPDLSGWDVSIGLPSYSSEGKPDADR